MTVRSDIPFRDFDFDTLKAMPYFFKRYSRDQTYFTYHFYSSLPSLRRSVFFTPFSGRHYSERSHVVDIPLEFAFPFSFFYFLCWRKMPGLPSFVCWFILFYFEDIFGGPG